MKIREPNADEIFSDAGKNKNWVLEQYAIALFSVRYPINVNQRINLATGLLFGGRFDQAMELSYPGVALHQRFIDCGPAFDQAYSRSGQACKSAIVLELRDRDDVMSAVNQFGRIEEVPLRSTAWRRY